MSKSILISMILFILAVTHVAAQDAFTPYEGTSKSYQVNNHTGSTYNWAVYTQLNPLVSANPMAANLSGNGNSQVSVQWNQTGEYYLLVTETDASGCTNTKAMRISVLPNNFKVLFTNLQSSACYQANNSFNVPLRFIDGTTQTALPANNFPMLVTYRLNGVEQTPQTVTFANQALTISGSAIAANPNSDNTVELTLTGATDSQNLTILAETTSAQHIHTHTIWRNLTIPTVTSLVTNQTRPTVSGTATVGANENLTVTLNGFSYSPGDGNLLLSGTDWQLTIPANRALVQGTYQVVARVSNVDCSVSDTSSDELLIDTTPPLPIPTVNTLLSNTRLPLITGTASVGPGETFSVKLNGKTYQAGDGKLVLTGNIWTLQIPAGSEIQDGVYSVVASVTDAAGNTSVNNTTNELTVNTLATLSDRIAVNDINITYKNTSVSGNVLTNDAGFFGFNSTVSTYLDPVNGSLSLSPDGKYTYIPKNNFTGTDNFYYSVCTSVDPADCDTVNVSVLVVDDVLSLIPPIAVDDEMLTLANSAVSGNVLSNDVSVSGEKLFVNTKPKDGPKSGTLKLNADGSFTYTPKSGFAGQDYFVYEVCGEISGLCVRARATITISNDPHAVNIIAADDLYFSPGKTITANLLANDKFPSQASLSVNKTPVVNAGNGTVAIAANGTFSYTPVAGFAGTDQFVYEICDTQLKKCQRATVYILVKETPALFADLSIQKQAPATINPGETITYQLLLTNLGTAKAEQIQINDYLAASILNPKYKLSGSTVQNTWTGYYELKELAVNQTFSLEISGTVATNAPDTIKNIATVTSLTWDPVAANNISTVRTSVLRGPVARIKGAPYVAVGSCSVSGRMLDASSSSGTELTYAWSPTVYLDNPVSATPVFRPGRTTRYRLTVTNNLGQTDTTSILVVVPNPPKAVTDRNVFVDTPNKTILLNGSNSTGAGLSFLWTSREGIILNGESTPTAQVSGLGIYYLQVTDSLGCMNRDSVNVGLYIQALNDTAETKINESVMINVVRNDVPAKSINPSSISIVTPPLHGIAEVAADSLILYIPEQTYIGQDEFVYAICDYFKNCDQAKVLVLISDLPFFIPEAFSPNGDGINDRFEIKGLAKYKTVEIQIFNRWGNIVYKSGNYGEGPGKDGFWDGVANNGLRVGSGPVPFGTYFYILKLNGKETINGSIYLDR